MWEVPWQSMKPKTLTIQLNDEQLPILPVEPEAHLSFTTHADGNELELTGNRAGLLLLAKAALGMAETLRGDGFHIHLDDLYERKELLAQKRAQLKIKQKRAEIQQYKDRLTKSIEHFSQKYRYADEAEALKIETFISKLNFEQPGQLAIQEVCPYPHGNAYLCFLMGTDALFEIYVFGKYSDIMSDHDAWEVFSPYLLLLDEDFIHYTYINDNGEVLESRVS